MAIGRKARDCYFPNLTLNIYEGIIGDEALRYTICKIHDFNKEKNNHKIQDDGFQMISWCFPFLLAWW